MTDEELNLLCTLFAGQKEIEQVILYGSRAKGTHKPFSDVDITLFYSHYFTFIADFHCKCFMFKESEVLPFLTNVYEISFKKSVELNSLVHNAES